MPDSFGLSGGEKSREGKRSKTFVSSLNLAIILTAVNTVTVSTNRYIRIANEFAMIFDEVKNISYFFFSHPSIQFAISWRQMKNPFDNTMHIRE